MEKPRISIQTLINAKMVFVTELYQLRRTSMRLGPPPSGPDFSALAITRKEWDIEELEEDIKVLKELYGLSNGERANAN